MLNPISDKFRVEFSSEFFDTSYYKKYNNFIYNLNGPIKDLVTHFYESIQQVIISGINAQPLTVTGINNLKGVGTEGPMGTKPPNMTETTISRSWIGNVPFDELLNSKTLTVNMKNTYINWLYSYEYFRDYFDRKRTVKDFRVTLTVLDSANIPMMQFIFSDCFIISLPDLEFLTNGQIREVRQFDLGIQFNRFDVKFIIPEFNNINLE